MNQPLSFGIITPSYAPDFERCRLLAWSADRFVKKPFNHYIVVSKSDYKLFSQLANAHTHILIVESLLPWWIKREPIVGKFWLSLKTLPIRSWVVQQIVKIATAQTIPEDIAVFIDSDVSFMRPFDLDQLGKDDRVRLYRDDVGNDVQRQMHQKWHEAASKLLGLSTINPGIPDYIGNLITWRKTNVVKLCQRLEAVSGRSWIEAIGSSWHFSEYILYGCFVDHVLPEPSGHYADGYNFCYDYWFPHRLSDAELQDLIDQVPLDKVAMMISAKANIEVDRYAAIMQAQMAPVTGS
jgi:hypothetical protein